MPTRNCNAIRLLLSELAHPDNYDPTLVVRELKGLRTTIDSMIEHLGQRKLDPKNKHGYGLPTAELQQQLVSNKG